MGSDPRLWRICYAELRYRQLQRHEGSGRSRERCRYEPRRCRGRYRHERRHGHERPCERWSCDRGFTLDRQLCRYARLRRDAGPARCSQPLYEERCLLEGILQRLYEGGDERRGHELDRLQYWRQYAAQAFRRCDLAQRHHAGAERPGQQRRNQQS